MKVICKHNIDSFGTKLNLTIGKSYDVIEIDSIGFKITNDSKYSGYYTHDRFYSTSELRDMTINQLLNE